MDNKEAIKKLKEQQAEFNDTYVDFAGINEAYNLAIKALEERPQGEWRDNLIEIFRQSAKVGGDMFHLSEIEQIINGEPIRKAVRKMKEYKPLDVEHNVETAIENLKEAYFSNDTEKYAKVFVEAENIIISAILFNGYHLKKDGETVTTAKLDNMPMVAKESEDKH